MPYDVGPNKQAIAMLERSVGLDRTYARAWAALGLRYGYHGSYSDGGKLALEQSDSAYERALTLDPNLISDAAAPLVLSRTEKGQLDAAYETAVSLVDRHPRNARAHQALGYVLRYAGLLEEAAAACDAALARDPTERRLRSCGIAFLHLRQYERAKDFLRLDAGSEFSTTYEARVFLHEGRTQAALEALTGLPASYFAHGEDLLRGCLEGRSQSDIEARSRQAQVTALAQRDPEPKYLHCHGAGVLRARGAGHRAVAAGDRREILFLSVPHDGPNARADSEPPRIPGARRGRPRVPGVISGLSE